MTVLAGAAVFTGMDVFGRAQEKPVYEERDWSFGGFDDDKKYFFDEGHPGSREFGSRDRDFENESRRRFDEDDFFDEEDDFFDEEFSRDEFDSREDSRSQATQDSETDQKQKNAEKSGDSQDSAAKDDSSQSSGKTGKSSDSKTDAKATAMVLTQHDSLSMDDAGQNHRDRHTREARMPGHVDGYGVTLFILELAGFAAVGAWLIVSRGNALTWSGVFARQTLPPVPAAQAETLREEAMFDGRKPVATVSEPAAEDPKTDADQPEETPEETKAEDQKGDKMSETSETESSENEEKTE